MNDIFEPLASHVNIVLAFVAGVVVGLVLGLSIALAALRSRVKRISHEIRAEEAAVKKSEKEDSHGIT